MENFKTDQEKFWAGNFGNEWIDRNSNTQALSNDIALFSQITGLCPHIGSAIEFGPGMGMNLKALKILYPDIKLGGVEINHKAIEILKNDTLLNGDLQIYEESIYDFQIKEQYDMSISKGVLITANPDFIPVIYEKLYEASNRFICIAEYYNPTPVEINYRGNHGKLFKRDFAGEMMDKYPDIQLVDYGFVYHRDYNFPQDDVNWFLLEKR